MLLELPVEVIEHDAGLDAAGAARGVEIEQPIEKAGAVDDEARIDRLAALRRAATARRYRYPRIPRNRQGRLRRLHRPRHHDARRHDLVARRIGCISTPAERIEQHVGRTPDLPLQPFRHTRMRHCDHIRPSAA